MIFLQICHKLDKSAIYLRPFSPLIVIKTFVQGKQMSLHMPWLVRDVTLKLLPIELSGSFSIKTYPHVNGNFFIISSYFVEVIKI